MRGFIATVVSATLGLAACSTPPPPELPGNDYSAWATSFARIEHCYATGRLNAEDALLQRQIVTQNIGRYTYDAGAINRMTHQMLTEVPAMEADPVGRRNAEMACAQERRKAAENRAILAQNRANQLHNAQIAAAHAAADAASWQPQPFVMPSYPSYRAPQVQTPQLGGGSNFYYCNRHSSHVVSCR